MSHQISMTQTAAVVVSHDAPTWIKHDYPVKPAEELALGECLVELHCTCITRTCTLVTKHQSPRGCP